jgi:hypothetical protein
VYSNFGVPRLGVPPIVFSEALHGFVGGCGARVDMGEYMSTGCPTSFPQVIALVHTLSFSLLFPTPPFHTLLVTPPSCR